MAKKAASKAEIEDTLAKTLADSVNKHLKHTGGQTVFFLEGEDSPANVKEWVSTGSTPLDLAISNRPNGGFPVGRITEVTGLEASGKSLLAAHALASTQKKGGLAVYIDTEAATSQEFLKAIGVDLEKMLYIPLEALEDIFEAIEKIIEGVRQSDKDRLVTIVVDSVMGATTKIEQDADYGKDGYATQKALILSKAMRKITNMIARERICLIFTNQLRTRLGVSFGDPWTTSGGKAIPFHSSVRLRLKSMGKIKDKVNGVEQVVGIQTRAVVVKNRMGPPLKQVDYSIFFDSGIDDIVSWLEILKSYGHISKGGAWYTLNIIDPKTGEITEEIKFQSKDFKEKILDVPKYRQYAHDRICESMISHYRHTENDPDSRVIDDDLSDLGD